MSDREDRVGIKISMYTLSNLSKEEWSGGRLTATVVWFEERMIDGEGSL